MTGRAQETRSTIDSEEVARFSAMAEEWWDPTGKFKPLHKFSPVRLGYIKDHVCRHFGRDPKTTDAFKGCAASISAVAAAC